MRWELGNLGRVNLGPGVQRYYPDLLLDTQQARPLPPSSQHHKWTFSLGEKKKKIINAQTATLLLNRLDTIPFPAEILLP